MGLYSIVQSNFPVVLAILMVVSDTVDNVFYTLSEKMFGQNIDLFSSFDAAFRRFAGRRNIYSFIFIIGFILGYPLQTFAIAAIWAAITACIHGIRLIYIRKEK